MPDKQVAIVGAGLAGLACAWRLQTLGISCKVFEKSDCVGGRVRTHLVNGYRLDRGFQVLLTAYPRSQETLDYTALRLKSFYPGAKIRYRGNFHTLGDPSRRPLDAAATLLAPIGSLLDKMRVLRLRNRVTEGTISDLLARPETTTFQRLREFGFSKKMIREFFKPFLGGIFLEADLVTSSRKFEFVMRMFTRGEAALPRGGMEAIPRQLANRLQPDVLQLNRTVQGTENGGLRMDDGELVPGGVVVLATPETEASRLLGKPRSVRSAAVSCFYYAADRSPVSGPWLVLNGDGSGPINNLCVPTEVHSTYAPPGKSLVSVSVLGPSTELAVRNQLVDWYGRAVHSWQFLQSFAIPEALTLQQPPLLEVVKKPLKLADNLFACGDYLSITSIEGAISSGMRCAEAIYGS